MPDAWREGIILHRKVDGFTDAHHQVTDLKREFPASIRRMAGVCIDVYFDHLLLHYWSEFCVRPVEDILETFYQELAQAPPSLSTRFAKIRHSLLTRRWLINYADHQTCHAVFLDIENRLKNRVKFADTAYTYMTENRERMHSAFVNFYPSLLDYATQLAQNKHELQSGRFGMRT